MCRPRLLPTDLMGGELKIRYAWCSKMMPPFELSMRRHFYVLACALLVSGCATKSHEWQQHTEDEFPTRVNWIISQVGNVLDAKRGLRYGTWTVTSDKGGPLATYQCPQGGICEINISNLQCQQATGGQTACELVLYKNAICELVIPEKKETLEIGCPIQVALKPKGEGETASPKEAAATAAAAAAAAAAAKGAQEAAGVAPPPAPKAAQEAAGAAPPTPKAPQGATPPAKAAQEPPPITPATEAKGAAPKEAAAAAAASEQAKGRSVGGDFVFGLRAGLIVPTQQILENLSSGTSVGPLINLEGYYVLTEWVRVGMMLEWQRYKINGRGAEVGTLSTFSFLPAVEFRPTRDLMRNTVGFEWLIPYASLGAGVNVHSFSNGAQLGNESISFPNTFALRVAGGFDFPITSNLAVNTEMAWKKDSGSFERSALTGGLTGDYNASSLMFLFGLRFHF